MIYLRENVTLLDCDIILHCGLRYCGIDKTQVDNRLDATPAMAT